MREKNEVHSQGKEKSQGSWWKGKKKSGSKQEVSRERKRLFSSFFKSSSNLTSTSKQEEYQQMPDSSLSSEISMVSESSTHDKGKGKEKESNLFPVKKNALSIHLDSLIKIDKHVELWRKTLVYETIVDNNDVKIKELKKYPWHTNASLLTLHNSYWLKSQLVLQKQQIQLIRILCEELLEPIFQQYMLTVDNELEQEQAQQLCNYLRRCIEQVMSNNLFEESSLLNPSFHENKGQFFANSIVFSDEQLEMMVRAKFQVQPLRFTEAQAFYPPFDIILPFICSKLDIIQYHYHLNELIEKTFQVGMLHRQNQQKISALRLDLEKGMAPENYVNLRSLLPPNKQFQQAVLSKLVEHLHSHMTPNHPRCTGEERDLFIPIDSLLLQSLTNKISAFVREHKKLQPATETLSPRFIEAMSTNLVKQLAVELLADQFVEPASKPLSHNFALM